MKNRARTLQWIILSMAVAASAWSIVQIVSTPSNIKGYAVRVKLPPTTGELALPSIGGERGDPLVVIDAGHGGHDPGAAGQGYQEKAVVLGLARALRDELLRQGGVRVALTRDDDRYLVHAERYELARRLEADLFVSIHADSAGDSKEVTGASIYTLSNDASSQAAARFAARENAADRLNGVDIGTQDDAVSDILVELSQRHTQEQSINLAQLILRTGEGNLTFHPTPLRSAALKVLRAPDVPSILFESGYITNEGDARRLTSAEGRKRFAETLARAIRIYFARRDQG